MIRKIWRITGWPIVHCYSILLLILVRNQPAIFHSALFRHCKIRPPNRWQGSTNLKEYDWGAPFKLGRHEWFALRRLITNSRNSAFTGSFWKRFLKETSKVDGRTKNRLMKRPLCGTLRLRNSPTGEQIQNGRRRVKLQETQILLDVAQNCFLLVFPLQLFLCRKFRNFLLRNKALAYLLTV